MIRKIINEFNKLSSLNQKLVCLTILLLAYGYLCRIIELYFFWESKPLGWSLLIVTVLAILVQRFKEKKAINKKTMNEKIFIGISVFVFTAQILILIIMPQTDAYKFAKNYLQTDKSISNQIGRVQSVILVPNGEISIEGEAGFANLNFIVKGENKYKDINLQLEKDINTNWAVIPAN